MIFGRNESTVVRHGLRFALALGLLGVLPGLCAAASLRLACQQATGAGVVRASIMKPVDVFLVAERDSLHPEISAVAYTLHVPDGLQVLGEELLVESILGLGTSTGGMNLVFRCVSEPSARILHFRVVATRPLQDAVLGLRPDTRTQFLGLIACKDEEYAKFDCPADSLRFTAR